MGFTNVDGLIAPAGVIGAMQGVGNVYVVYGSASSSASEMERRYGSIYYEDGSKMLHRHTSTSTTVTENGLKNALACTVEDRNDYVIVMPANATYYVDAALAMDKKAVHLVCPAGLGYEIGSTNAARIQQITASTAIIAVSDASIEIAGLYLKNINGASAITIAATSYALNIHHNTFPLIWTSSGIGSIIGTGDGGAWGKIERNWFVSQSGGGVTCAAGVIQIQASATACQVNHNQITIGDTQVATIGIANGAVKGATNYNLFSSCGGSGVSDGGTITNCVSIAVSGCAIGNRCAVTTGQFAAGGTASYSFTDNMDGVTGNTGGQITNLEA